MLAVLIYLVNIARRTLRKVIRSVAIVVESFHEAQELRRKAGRLYVED